MVKHSQTIRRLLPTNYLSVFDHFVSLALKEVSLILLQFYWRKLVLNFHGIAKVHSKNTENSEISILWIFSKCKL